MAIIVDKPPLKSSRSKLLEMLKANWYLGCTSFGGPAAHFQTFHRLFVQKNKWIDENMYQELFALCQALPGPGSTKMLYCINFVHCGFSASLLSFFIWSLPGAIACYGLALGITQLEGKLPPLANAAITGLNAAAIGIITQAAVYLSAKSITDRLTRILVFLGAAGGLLYTAFWYFPALMVAAGFVTTSWDHILEKKQSNRLEKSQFMKERRPEARIESIKADKRPFSHPLNPSNFTRTAQTPQGSPSIARENAPEKHLRVKFAVQDEEAETTQIFEFQAFSWKTGTAIVAFSALAFITIMILRGILKNQSRSFDIFANMYLAGTIIFGGGPVVIPLLREYVVAPGWVSSKDFLLGLAIFQAFPGPNFNFAVYLGALAVTSSSINPIVGALIGYVALFSPGLILHIGAIGIWRRLRSYRWVVSCLRGINAAAVGLIYTAVFRLWEMGSSDEIRRTDIHFGTDPWWIIIAAASFVGSMWFNLPAPAAIFMGGLMGMMWYGVVKL